MKRRGPWAVGRGPLPRSAAPGLAVALLAAAGLLMAGRASGQTRVVDDFAAGVGAWVAAPSEGVSTTLTADSGALRVDVDFHGGSGWALIHRPLPLSLPASWAFSFRIRGDLPPETLEFKLVDPSGDNVWWSRRSEFEPNAAWRTITVRRRNVSFAWGPAGGGELDMLGALEIAFTAGTGGKGTVWIDDLTFTELPAPSASTGPPTVTASSESGGHPATAATDGDATTSWRPAGEGPAWLQLDFGGPREYGGAVVTWDRSAVGLSYTVQSSDDGSTWSVARTVAGSNGGADVLALPDGESRFLRVSVPSGAAAPGVAGLEVMPAAFGESPNAVYAEIARRAPRGRFPRAFVGEQTYWTVVGADGASHEALLSEDGAVEVDKGAFSVEPFLRVDSDLLSWSDGEESQSLADGYLPIPTVTRTTPRAVLEVTALATGDERSSSLLVHYAVRNPTPDPLRCTLYLAVRPLQVNPPTQFLGTPGGVARVDSIETSDAGALVGGDRRLFVWPAPSAAGATTFDGGDVSEYLAAGAVPPAQAVFDPEHRASAALAFDLAIEPGGRAVVVAEAPFPGSGRFPREPGLDAAVAWDQALERTRVDWRAKLNRVTISLPESARAFADTLRSNLAYILVNRDGPAIQPGSRAYERSWIRDGALTSTALLRLGHAAEVRDFIDWFAAYQFPSGKVPCCVDSRGADPVAENDSNGELLYLIAEYWRLTRDRAVVEAHWDNVKRAVGYLDTLRHQTRTEAFRAPDTQVFFGLLPESISHEGYSAKPMHSYWDDFWALRGLQDAVTLADVVGRRDEAARFAAISDEFRADLYTSLFRTMEQHKIDYVPGCAELGDYDPTSTTIAVSPGGEQKALSPEPLGRTFERYWQESVARRDGQREWDDYTPYELRNVGVMVRLGWRDRAMAMLDFFMRDRRPAAWNQWAEVVGRDPRKPRFIGDMPHTWVGSDFVRSFLDTLAWERDRDRTLVLMSGVPRAWIDDPEGIVVEALRTQWGLLSFRTRTEDGRIVVDVADGVSVPAGGVVLDLPLSGPPRRVTVDGHRYSSRQMPIVVRAVPAHVEVTP